MTTHAAADQALRILLIDDEELIAGSLRQYLVGQGYEIDTARDRGSAEELMRLRRYALVLVDPYMTGEAQAAGSIVAAIRHCQPEAFLVLVTAYPSGDLARIAGEQRAGSIVSKPKPVPFLAHLIETLIRNPNGSSGADLRRENPKPEVPS